MNVAMSRDKIIPKTVRPWYLTILNTFIRFGRLIIVLVIAYVVYATLLDTIFTRELHLFTYLAFWLFTAYIVLPRFNRWISKLYLPDYFIGRARTGDGLLGDPINLALDGKKGDIIKTMQEAGWTRAESLTLQSSTKMIYTSMLKKTYPDAPVSPLYLFGNVQDLAFQKEVNSNPRKRHHIRFWKTPVGWYLPGGHKAGWLGAATYDKHVGISLFTGQITHKIDADVDKERDFVLKTLENNNRVVDVGVIKHFTTSYHGRNGGGDMIETDGSLPFVKIG